eukprot:scaffold27810_cov153-Skeletonema_marinoi.AAC.1
MDLLMMKELMAIGFELGRGDGLPLSRGVCMEEMIDLQYNLRSSLIAVPADVPSSHFMHMRNMIDVRALGEPPGEAAFIQSLDLLCFKKVSNGCQIVLWSFLDAGVDLESAIHFPTSSFDRDDSQRVVQ